MGSSELGDIFNHILLLANTRLSGVGGFFYVETMYVCMVCYSLHLLICIFALRKSAV